MSSQRDYTPDPLNRAARGLSARLPKLRPERADAGGYQAEVHWDSCCTAALGGVTCSPGCWGRRLRGAADSRMLNVAVAAMAGLIRTQRGIAGRSAQPMASEHI